MIERIEEECLSKILEAGKNCPTSLLYLETGQLPARNQIQIMMLNFLKFILDTEKGNPCYPNSLQPSVKIQQKVIGCQMSRK